jgi:hypothetical protein
VFLVPCTFLLQYPGCPQGKQLLTHADPAACCAPSLAAEELRASPLCHPYGLGSLSHSNTSCLLTLNWGLTLSFQEKLRSHYCPLCRVLLTELTAHLVTPLSFIDWSWLPPLITSPGHLTSPISNELPRFPPILRRAGVQDSHLPTGALVYVFSPTQNASVHSTRAGVTSRAYFSPACGRHLPISLLQTLLPS